MTEQIYCVNSKFNEFLVPKKIQNTYTAKKKIHTIVAGAGNLFFLLEDNSLVSTMWSGPHFIKKETITKISGAYFSFMAITESGKCYVCGTNCNGQLGLGKSVSESKKPRLVNYLVDKNLLIRDVNCGNAQTYLITDQDMLYGMGWNNNGRLGLGTKNKQQVYFPEKIFENVSKVFCGNYADHFFFLTTSGELYAAGGGRYGKSGLGKTENSFLPEKIDTSFLGGDVVDICNGCDFSLLLDQSGSVYMCGKAILGSENQTIFRKVDALSGIRITNISCGGHFCVLKSESNNYYSSGTQNQMQSVENYSKEQCNLLKVPNFIKNSEYTIACGVSSTFIYPKKGQNTSINNFCSLSINGTFTDMEIQGINFHQSFLEFRIGQPIKKIISVIEILTKKEIEIFRSWVYSDLYLYNSVVKKALEKLGITDLKVKKFSNDLARYYNDEDSKDFIILVPVEDDDDDDEGEEEFEEIYVHKIVLLGRSGLFREMFKNVKEISNTVTEFSHKTIESLELLIKYFYTNKIVLTADDDPELVYEELSDAKEYYQLDKNSNFSFELNKIKNKN
ncbi:regulator of chromosome condensation [Anaeramoeba flamelloides]|uniref:Regulator of chromosome condensation n=1 Tax=Anaeramoeba flamelloides TaxID=1746091 RepID=A0ABQ8X6S1_9EUKA|nr:regulator of chromosome condensation [Anaeramoeba flamelloides]